MEQKSSSQLRIIHFNDVYNIQEYKEEPVGGVARFITGIVLFSGDAYSPSMLSSLYDGVQILEPLNKIGIDIACLGNHELDYGLETLVDLTKKNNFPWMMSNVYNALTEENIADTIDYKIIEKNGIKIGLMGLAEEEWLGLVTEIDPNILDYEDFVDCAKRLCLLFKKEKCDLIVALTHMRNPNDLRLAEEVPEIDLILGGHDHVQLVKLINDQTLFMKSGTDFRLFSYNDIENVQDIPEKQKSIESEGIYVIKNKWRIQVNFQEITKQIEPEPEIQKHVDYYISLSEKEMQKVIGYTATFLDTRFSVIRAEETRFGNFFADVIRIDMDAEISIINTGTIRADQIIPEGEIKFDTLNKLLPIHDTILSMEINGKQLHEALENGVSKYPRFDGRFPSVSNIKFTFDASAPPMQRIKKEDIIVMGQPIDYERVYTCAMKYFLSIGKDGYDVFKNCKYIVDEENGTPHLNTLKNFFYSFKRDQKQLSTMSNIEEELCAKVDDIKIENENPHQNNPKQLVRKRSIILTEQGKRRSTQVNTVIQQLSDNSEKGITQQPSNEQKIQMVKQQESINNTKYYQYKQLDMIYGFKKSSDTNEDIIVINPKIEGRITILNKDKAQEQK